MRNKEISRSTCGGYMLVQVALLLFVAFAAGPFFVSAQGPPPGWSSVIRITNTPGDSHYADVAIGPTGNLHFTFEDTSSSHPQAWYAQLDPNGNSIVPVRRVSFTGANAIRPDIAVDGANNAFFAWTAVRDTNAQHRNIYARKISTTGASFTRQITQDGKSQSPAIVVDRQTGSMYVVFQKATEYTNLLVWYVYFAKLDNNLNIIIPPTVLDAYLPRGEYVDIAIGPDSTLHVVREIGYYLRLNSNGQRIGNEVIFAGPGATLQEYRVIRPKIAVDQQNNAHIVFTTPLQYPTYSGIGSVKGGYAVYVKMRNGQIVAGPVRVHSPSTMASDYGAEDADIAVDEQGRAHVVVQTYERFFSGSSSKLMYYTIDTQGVVSPPTDLDPTGWMTERPTIAASGGRVFVAWDYSYGTNNMEVSMKIKS